MRVVGRAVVDDDEFPARLGLGEDALEGAPQDMSAVVGGQDDGDEGFHDLKIRGAVGANMASFWLRRRALQSGSQRPFWEARRGRTIRIPAPRRRRARVRR